MNPDQEKLNQIRAELDVLRIERDTVLGQTKQLEKNIEVLQSEIETQTTRLAQTKESVQLAQNAKSKDLDEKEKKLFVFEEELLERERGLDVLSKDLDHNRNQHHADRETLVGDRQALQNLRDENNKKLEGLIRYEKDLSTEKERLSAVSSDIKRREDRLSEREETLDIETGSVNARESAVDAEEKKLEEKITHSLKIHDDALALYETAKKEKEKNTEQAAETKHLAEDMAEKLREMTVLARNNSERNAVLDQREEQITTRELEVKLKEKRISEREKQITLKEQLQ